MRVGWGVLGIAMTFMAQGVARAEEGPPRCAPGFEWMGDRVLGQVDPGRWISTIEELMTQETGPLSWQERSRIRSIFFELVALEQPGNAAALYVLSRQDSGFCVVTGWGYSFGGLGVELTVADYEPVYSDEWAELIVLEAMAEYNNPIDDPTSPEEPRRVVLAVGPDRAAVVADTQGTRLAPFARAHWFLEQSGRSLLLRIVRSGRIVTFRYDPRHWRFLH